MSTEDKKRRVVLFDMDGTLVPWDTQYVFAGYVVRKHPWRVMFLFYFLLHIPLFLLRFVSEEYMKRFFMSYLCGLSAEVVSKYGEEFARRLAEKAVFPEVLAELRAHLANGDECWLVSASPDFYVVPFARNLGFFHAIGTEVNLAVKMPICPELIHGNNKGERKVHHLQALGVLPEDGELINSLAYSDSRADLPMLKACERQVLVNPSEALKTEFTKSNVKVLCPPLPWKNKSQKFLMILSFVMGMRSL